MSKPIVEPTQSRKLIEQEWGARQLYRRPASASGTAAGCDDFTELGSTDLENGWAWVGSPWETPGYRICEGVPEIKGFVEGGADCTVVFNWPVTDRPTEDWVLVGIDTAGNVVEWHIDSSTGDVTLCLANCTAGQTGGDGPTGPTGPTGAQGVSLGAIEYLWDSGTGSSDPGTGHLRFNNGTIGSVTNWFISETDNRGNGLQPWISAWDDSTHTALRGTLFIVQELQPAIAGIFNVTGAITDNGAWDTVPVTYVGGAGGFADEDPVLIWFSRTGDDGAAGSTGPTGATGATGSGGSDWTATIVKSSDETVTSSTTLQDDDELQFTPTASKSYLIEVCLIYARAATGSTNPGLKATNGADSNYRGTYHFGAINTALNAINSGFTGYQLNASQNFGTEINGNKYTCQFVGAYTADSGATQFKVQWAQATSSTNGTRVYAGSILRYKCLDC